MAVGLSFLLSGSKLVGILCIGCYGAGLGLAVPAANLLVAAANPQRRSAALNLLNCFWSVGAVSCPFLVATAAKSNYLPTLLISVAAFSLATSIGISLMPSRILEPATIRDAQLILPLIRGKLGAFSILALLFLLYVGVENSFGQWIASYAKSLGTLSLAMSLATPSFFYASLMLGRWLAPLILRLVSDARLVQAGSLLACAGMAGLIFSRDLSSIAFSACAAGLGLSSVYPITISFLSKQFESANVGSLMFTLSNVGGGLLPWIVGLSSNRFGTLKAGLLVPLGGCTTIYLLFLRGSIRHGVLSSETDPSVL
jgi:FHS family Na+ dependent glucose MFS transporter 1